MDSGVLLLSFFNNFSGTPHAVWRSIVEGAVWEPLGAISALLLSATRVSPLPYARRKATRFEAGMHRVRFRVSYNACVLRPAETTTLPRSYWHGFFDRIDSRCPTQINPVVDARRVGVETDRRAFPHYLPEVAVGCLLSTWVLPLLACLPDDIGTPPYVILLLGGDRPSSLASYRFNSASSSISTGSPFPAAGGTSTPPFATSAPTAGVSPRCLPVALPALDIF